MATGEKREERREKRRDYKQMFNYMDVWWEVTKPNESPEQFVARGPLLGFSSPKHQLLAAPRLAHHMCTKLACKTTEVVGMSS